MDQLKNTTEASNLVSRRAVRARVIEVEKRAPTMASGSLDDSSKSKQLSEDPFSYLMESGQIIAPPFDLLSLAMLDEQNSELGPCVEAMEVNIEGFGHRLVPRFTETAPEAVRRAAQKEKVRLENFFAYASLKDSYTQLRRKVRKDLEKTGNAYKEILRDARGEIQGFQHVPSYQVRLSVLEQDPIEVEIPILELQEDGSFAITRIRTWQRFRKYVQSTATQMGNLTYVGGYKLRWFKEYGDPRVYDNETGELVPPEKVRDFPLGQRANELAHFTHYSSRSPYGLPRFIGNLLAVYGDRASEEVNYTTLKNNNIPSMMLLVSNGQLTEASIDRIKDFVASQIQGADNYSKFLLLEAEGEEEGEDGGQVKIDVKPLTDTQHKDSLFQHYSKNNQDKIRRAFRLPPILVGRSDDYSRSTADTARKLADEQVFAPERSEYDTWINRRIFPEMGITHWKYRSNSPNTTDNTELVKILGGAEKTGGMTPRIARMMLEDILGQELPEFPADFENKVDLPFSLLMAEAVKNKADPAEPGQQVTALKSLDLIDKLTAGELHDTDEAALASYVVTAQKHFEQKWRRQIEAGFGDPE